MTVAACSQRPPQSPLPKLHGPELPCPVCRPATRLEIVQPGRMHAQQPRMTDLHASMLPCGYVAKSSPRPSGLHAWKRMTLQRRQ